MQRERERMASIGRKFIVIDWFSTNTTTGIQGLGLCLSKKTIGYYSNEFCRSFREEQGEESVEHYLCHRPALITMRRKFLGEYLFDCLTVLPCDI